MNCRTKIVGTIGPASASEERLRQLMESGMDVARLNFSHGTREEHGETIKRIRRVAESLGRPLAILQDLAGAKLRIGRFLEEPVCLKAEETFTLTEDDADGDVHRVSLSRPGLAKAVRPGDRILLADGAIELEVREVGEDGIRCRVVTGGELRSHKGVNVPSRAIEGDFLTEKDGRDLRFALEAGVDLVALSYVRRADDVRRARGLVRENGAEVPLVAKIETQSALDQFDGILREADAIMIARGDLGVEISLEQIPRIQRMLIRRVNRASKPVITATQMLRSMVENPRPTRAEVTDVANAVLEGTDALMLSEETAIGEHPVAAVRMMRRIAAAAAESGPREMGEGEPPDDPTENAGIALYDAACALAENAGAAAIVTFDAPRGSPRLLASRRPARPILVLADDDDACRRLNLLWGTTPVKLAGDLEGKEDLLRTARLAAVRTGQVKPGERIVVVLLSAAGSGEGRGGVELVEARGR